MSSGTPFVDVNAPIDTSLHKEDAVPGAIIPQVVLPPAYTDPQNPAAASGSINHPADKHTLVQTNTLAEDYGQVRLDGESETIVGSGIAANADDLSGVPEGLSENREEWSKANWQEAASNFGLPTSGNIATLKERVEQHEAEQEQLGERQAELAKMNRAQLEDAAKAAKIDNAEAYPNMETLAAAVLAAESGEDVPPPPDES